jgi:hypothetical protein
MIAEASNGRQCQPSRGKNDKCHQNYAENSESQAKIKLWLENFCIKALEVTNLAFEEFTSHLLRNPKIYTHCLRIQTGENVNSIRTYIVDSYAPNKASMYVRNS